MKNKERVTVDVVVSKTCDICGKTLTDMTTISWYEYGMQGMRDTKGDFDVCSAQCFLDAIKNTQERWATITGISIHSESLVK